MIVRRYTKLLQLQKASELAKKPPSYIECLINGNAVTPPATPRDIIIFGIRDETNPIDEKNPLEDDVKKNKIENLP